MQINYPYEDVRRSTARFWYPPSIANTIQAMDVPPIYAPYGTKYFWPNGTVGRTQITQTTPDTALLARNSAKRTTVASSAMMGGFGADAPPASSPAAAAATGQSLGPVSLVAPMPSITPAPNLVSSSAPPVVCNSVDTWVTANPMLAALGIVGAFLFFGGHK